jgi:hypothetical protein
VPTVGCGRRSTAIADIESSDVVYDEPAGQCVVRPVGEHRPRRNVIHDGSLHLTGQKVLNADSFGSATQAERAPHPAQRRGRGVRDLRRFGRLSAGPSAFRRPQPQEMPATAARSRPANPAAVTFPPRPPRLAAGRARSWSSCRARRRRRPGARRCAGQRSESARRRSHRSGARSGRPERAVWQR